MTEFRQVRSLGIEAEGKTFFFSYDEGPPPDGHFRVDSLYSGFSAGTELTFYKGSNPYLHNRWDDEFGLFVPGEPQQSYPLPFLGYMEVGRVTETRTAAVKTGDIVAMTYGHKTGHTANPVREFFKVLPPELDPVLGIYVAQMGPICANGLLHAAADLMGPAVHSLGDGVRGRYVLVTGGGVIGLFTGLFARHLGAAEVALADSSTARLAAARQLGLLALDEREQDVARACKERWFYGGNDRGADVVFQCRAQGSSLRTALRSLRPQGVVIDLAFYQDGLPEVRLGEEFHHNGLAIHCAQIGRVPRGLAHSWGRPQLAAETLNLLLAHGPAIREHIITDIVPFEDAPQVLADLARRRRPAIQVVFDYSSSGHE